VAVSLRAAVNQEPSDIDNIGAAGGGVENDRYSTPMNHCRFFLQ
jgi:hypothetical protein